MGNVKKTNTDEWQYRLSIQYGMSSSVAADSKLQIIGDTEILSLNKVAKSYEITEHLYFLYHKDFVSFVQRFLLLELECRKENLFYGLP